MEEDFPRGGYSINQKEKHDQNKSFNKPQNLFGVSNTPLKKKSKVKSSKRTVESNVVAKPILADNVDTLTFQKIEEGLLVMGCVRSITNMSVEIELPGRTSGKLSIDGISNEYSKHLSSRIEESNDLDSISSMIGLNKMFSKGQYLPIKVIGKIEKDSRIKLSLSIRPDVINCNFNHTKFTEGMLIWTSIIEKSDHCYHLSVGVANCRVILPLKYVQTTKYFLTGQTLWCIVKGAKVSKEATIITVSVLDEDLNGAINSSISLDLLTPGTKVKFTIEKVVRDGLRGHFLDDCIGYIYRSQLSNPLDKLNDYKSGQHLEARVLYVQHSTKYVYLTLRSLDDEPTARLTNGTKTKGTVIIRSAKGLYLKLDGDEKGFLPYNRVLNSVRVATSSDLEQTIKQKFPIGATFPCRILDYIRIERTYICSNEAEVMKESHFTLEDMKVGSVVRGCVKEVVEAGVVVQVGKLEGFVQNMHLSNAQYSAKIKSGFKVGKKVTGKILYVTKQNFQLTLKQLLIDTNIHLDSLEDIDTSIQYPGVVVNSDDTELFVSFYGDIVGKLNICEMPQYEGSIRNVFYTGEVILTTVIKTIKGKLVLSMKPPTLSKSKRLIVGNKYSGKVERIGANALYLRAENNIAVEINKSHLSNFIDLGPALLKTYQISDEINSALCISNDNAQTLSIRESKQYKLLNQKVPFVGKVKCGDIIRCSFESKAEDCLTLTSPMKYLNLSVFVQKSFAAPDDTSYKELDLQLGQPIIGKVIQMQIRKDKKIICMLNTQLSNFFNYDYNYTVNFLESYLTDLNKLEIFGMSNKNPLLKYKIGHMVDCVVKAITQSGCVAVLPNGITARIAKSQYNDEIQCGSTINGCIVARNFVDNYLYVSVITQKVNKKQGIIIPDDRYNVNIKALLVLVTDLCAVALLMERDKSQFIYLPVKIHENDFSPDRTYYDDRINTNIKIRLLKYSNGRIIGFERKLMMAFEKKLKLFKKHNKSKSNDDLVASKLSTVNENKKQLKDEDIIMETESDSEFDDDIKYSFAENLNDDDISSSNIENSFDDSESEDNSSTLPKKKRKIATVLDEPIEKRSKTCESSKSLAKTIAPILSGVSDFFDNDDNREEQDDDSDQEEVDSSSKSDKKKKLSAAERMELARIEEDRLRKIETELADSTAIPVSAEQFDRALMGNPNSSMLWSQYISFHMQSTEIEKARSVAKRALQIIQQTEVQERLNVWTVYMNLEFQYGTRDSYEEVLKQAANCNDSLTIYLVAIGLHASKQEFKDVDTILKKLKREYKNSLDMWMKVGKIYYDCKMFTEGRKLKDDALKNITDKRTQINLIVQFAILEFTHGEQNQGEVLFETIIQSDPRRVDVWCTYVDQLVKNNNIDLARRVLERAVGQKLIYKRMKVLFKKYHTFELKHGDVNTINNVEKLVQEFTSSVK